MSLNKLMKDLHDPCCPNFIDYFTGYRNTALNYIGSKGWSLKTTADDIRSYLKFIHDKSPDPKPNLFIRIEMHEWQLWFILYVFSDNVTKVLPWGV